MSVTWTQADIDSLKAAVASGVLRVHYSGPPSRSVEYHSLQAMRDLLASMEASVGVAAGTRPAFRLASSRKSETLPGATPGRYYGAVGWRGRRW
jgi:hypothetical protein